MEFKTRMKISAFLQTLTMSRQTIKRYESLRNVYTLIKDRCYRIFVDGFLIRDFKTKRESEEYFDRLISIVKRHDEGLIKSI